MNRRARRQRIAGKELGERLDMRGRIVSQLRHQALGVAQRSVRVVDSRVARFLHLQRQCNLKVPEIIDAGARG
ncbi:hypothetical protein, partial [Burkholderia cenocepacia]|uniref:hypothetical protein n=1 Tax=Burkholderia cenocepacia TaxID=95486 RepID=UPI001EFADEF0